MHSIEDSPEMSYAVYSASRQQGERFLATASSIGETALVAQAERDLAALDAENPDLATEYTLREQLITI